MVLFDGSTTLVVGGGLLTITVVPGLVPLTPGVGSDTLQGVRPIRHGGGIPRGQPPVDGRGRGAITEFVRLPPVTLYWTLVTPDEATASRFWLPDSVAAFDGNTTVVTGGGLLTVIVMPGLVPLRPPEVATLCRVYVPFGTVVVFQTPASRR